MKALIIGAGNIGIRHLQGLKSARHNLKSVTVVDPDPNATFRAYEMGHFGIVKYSEVIPSGNYDIVIVATNSKERRGVIEKIQGRYGFLLLEKFLFHNESEYFERLPNAFVNCPRRIMPGYIKLKQELSGFPVNGVICNLPGLLSNSIHWMDFVSYLTGKKDLIFCFTPGEILKSKRNGYNESSGILDIESGNTRLRVFNLNQNKIFTISINGREINETEKTIDGEPFEYKLQSELTGDVVNQWIENGTCGLTDYEQSAEWHLQILRELRRVNWNLPIT